MQTNNRLREALTKILNLTNSLDEECAVDPVEIRDIANAALAEPVRNYEVGTAEEQYNRHYEYCISQPTCREYLRVATTCICILCFAKWAQRPYEEGGIK